MLRQKSPGLNDISLYGGLPRQLGYGMDHTQTYPAEEAANLYAEATAALFERFDIIDGLKIMTMLGAVESITALNEPPHKVGIAAIEAAQALVLRNPNVGGPLSVRDANAIVDALQIHLDLFLGQTAKPRRGAKEGVLARRVAQTLSMRHTSYPHHARRIHDAIWFELEGVGHTTFGMSLGQAGKLAQAAAYGVAVRLVDSPVLRDIGKWMVTGSGPFEHAWTGLFEIDMQVLAAVVRDVPRTALDALFDRLSVSPGDLAQANPDHLHLDNPIWRKPFVKFDGRLFCFTPQTLFWAQDEVLAELATSIWQQPAQNLGEARGAALERLLGETLTKMLPHARVLTSSKWTDPRDGRGYETDAIVLIDGMVLIWEAKSVALSAIARRGSNEWFKTFDDIVVQACVQATERAYICFLLVRTLYFPRSHNIKFLRSLAEDGEPRLIEVWPRATRIDRRRFELLKRAYVEARYSASYEIGNDDLDALLQSVRALRDSVETVSRERIETLRTDAGL